jgi:hypothetical protein
MEHTLSNFAVSTVIESGSHRKDKISHRKEKISQHLNNLIMIDPMSGSVAFGPFISCLEPLHKSRQFKLNLKQLCIMNFNAEGGKLLKASKVCVVVM